MKKLYISIQEAKTGDSLTARVKMQCANRSSWPHVSNHIFLYKSMRTRVGSPFTDIENALQLNFTRQLSTRRY